MEKPVVLSLWHKAVCTGWCSSLCTGAGCVFFSHFVKLEAGLKWASTIIDTRYWPVVLLNFVTFQNG